LNPPSEQYHIRTTPMRFLKFEQLYWDSRQCYKVFDNLDIFILHSRFFFQSRNENAISKLALTQHSIVDLWGEKNGYFYMLISSKKKWSNNIGKKKFGWSSHGACHCWKWNTSNKLLNELTQIESREGKERKKKLQIHIEPSMITVFITK
jgi:hypothetical protein